MFESLKEVEKVSKNLFVDTPTTSTVKQVLLRWNVILFLLSITVDKCFFKLLFFARARKSLEFGKDVI